MTAALRLRPVVKEARALALVFGACLAAMAVAFSARFRSFAEPGYLLGVMSLGALSIGHEYSHGTVVQMLAQPMRRAQMLLTKLGVLAAMLAVLGAAAWMLFVHDLPGMTPSGRLAFLVFPPLAALCLGPWLTMVGRSTIAGAVFSFCLPGVLWTAIMLLHLRIYGEPASTEFALVLWWRGAVALCAVGAVMTWRTFLRLEAVGGHGMEIQLPRFGMATTAARRRHPIWLLAAKDVRLQQMTLALVALYCVAWPACVVLGGRYLEGFYVVSIIFTVLIAMLAGALSSAEERQLGTLEPQTLLPIPAGTQWIVKVAVACAVTFVLGVGLPYLFMTLAPSDGVNAPRAAMFVERPFVLIIGALMVGALYTSSLATSGVRALVLAAPVFLGFGWSLDLLQRYVANPFMRMLWGHGGLRVTDVAFRAARYTPYVLIGAFLLMLLRFAFTNHRSPDRPLTRIAAQAASVAAFAILFILVMAVASGLIPPIRLVR